MGFICGIDTGGTFTDCVVIDEQGRVTTAKASSTPGDFSRGILDSLTIAAGELGIDRRTFLTQVDAIFHGTTVATNAMVERTGVRTALLSTAGHSDALSMMRGGRTAGLSPDEYLRVSRARKPDPIVPRALNGEIEERIDARGQVIVPLDEEKARAVIRRLLERDVRSIGVCLLWSFRNPAHEKTIGRLIREEAPDDIYVTLSHELIPKWGEYERAAGTAINGYIGPLVKDYLSDLEMRANEEGLDGPVFVMKAGGGLGLASHVTDVAVNTIGSGPVAGVTGSARFAAEMGHADVICADMGGTTFDVGMIVGGQTVRRSWSVMSQYEYHLPQVDVRSVGAGGGSVIWIDPVSRALRVGPKSAGANPGPVSYGRGNEHPTVTDADLVLGILDEKNFLGGQMPLSRDLAEQAIGKLAAELELDAIELAAGVVKIVDGQMAELIRQMTVESGYDPRDFVVFAYGGAGPTHGVGFASELGAQAVIVPLMELGSLWSAYGVASSDLVELVEQTDIMLYPFDLGHLNESLEELEARACGRLVDQGVEQADIVVTRDAFLRYIPQLNEVSVPLSDKELTVDSMNEFVEAFGERYERLYGKGSSVPGAAIELVTLSIEARGRLRAQSRIRGMLTGRSARRSRAVPAGRREVFWPTEGSWLPSRIFSGNDLSQGDELPGPSLAELRHTTIAIPPGFVGRIDTLGNCVITF
jgi:N-methylhydantoinase A